MPPGDRGAISGLATTTKGVGLVIGPLLAGIVIDLMRDRLPETDGYQAVWPVLGVPILVVLPFVAMLDRAERATSVSPSTAAAPPRPSR
jgi:MFS family permease